MYISRLKISNILGFQHDRNVDLGFQRPDGSYAGWTVLAGRNGSGKTSVLRSLALAAIGFNAAQHVAPNYPAWRSRGSGHISVEHALDPVEAEGAGESGYVTTDIKLPRPVERVLESGGRSTVHSFWTHPGVEIPTRNWFVAGYGPFRRLSDTFQSGPSDTEVSDTVRASSRVTTLFDENESLAEGVTWLLSLHVQRLEKNEGARELLRTVIAVLGDGLLPDGYRVSRIDSRGLWVKNGDTHFPLTEMSDGYRAVTALVLDLIRGMHGFYGSLETGRGKGARKTVLHPGVVLIDEIDAHLHISWQKRIGGWLKAHFPNIQFIVTTHSPYACQAADPGGLIRLAGPGEARSPEVVGQDLYRRIVHGSGDDAALSELFGLDSPYSPEGEALRRELIALEESVFAGTATKRQTARYHELAEVLSSSSTARVDEVAARLGGGHK
ncbi:AAA family ATPase [Kitasatospora purpeofusca]|uniref:AAA family ATPase n=1 Tax=Kitasatospora purpeofusca TaxID=67352 RepID=UPI00225AE02F|nr:ATP-binding protein [Kitasatospora purpeofusca]MCX4686989.1 AAA family ATPase [Kitasatospora purpeofusca]